MLVYSFLLGLGFGAYISIDLALMTEVLPASMTAGASGPLRKVVEGPASSRWMPRKADEGGIPGRISTEENAARCVPGRRQGLRDLASAALDPEVQPRSLRIVGGATVRNASRQMASSSS